MNDLQNAGSEYRWLVCFQKHNVCKTISQKLQKCMIMIGLYEALHTYLPTHTHNVEFGREWFAKRGFRIQVASLFSEAQRLQNSQSKTPKVYDNDRFVWSSYQTIFLFYSFSHDDDNIKSNPPFWNATFSAYVRKRCGISSSPKSAPRIVMKILSISIHFAKQVC